MQQEQDHARTSRPLWPGAVRAGWFCLVVTPDTASWTVRPVFIASISPPKAVHYNKI
jgi:hypothetical protein